MALLPNHTRAFIAIEKLSDYCLNPFHPVGKDKAMVFKSALNLTEQDADYLRDLILKGLAENEAVSGIQDQYGIRYSVDIKIRNLDKEVEIRTGWIIKKGEKFPRFTTCYIK
jgi:hypothetical protein